MSHIRMFAVLIVLVGLASHALADGGHEAIKKKAAAAAVEVIVMRSTLARNFVAAQSNITEDTVLSVCNAVSRESETIMKRDNLKIRYAAVKYRDPANKATPAETAQLESFDKDRSLKHRWDEVKADGKEYLRYSRPIFIEKACLICHGARDKRPDAIAKLYPDDKAYDFELGNLRGMVEVLVEK